MGGLARWSDLARTAAVALLAGVVALSAAGSAEARWSRPVRLAGPFSLDLLPTQITFAPDGRAAVAFGLQDEDHPATSESFIVPRSASGRFGRARQVPAQQVLDLAFEGQTLELLTGRTSPGKTCCSSAGLVGFSGRSFGRTRTLVDTLTGEAIGRLLALPGSRLLAAVATAEGVWVSQPAPTRTFGPARLLSPRRSAPQTLAAASVSGGRTVVAWTAAIGQPAQAPPNTIFEATGSKSRAPSATRPAYTAGTGHQIDELALGGTTAAWIESWYDAEGAYHSEAVVANLDGRIRPRSFPIAAETASGLSFAANGAGDQVLAWQACSTLGSCTVVAAVKDAGKRFGSPLDLGPIDPSQTPAATVSSRGQAVVGWIEGGHVVAATRRRRARGFDRPQTVSAASYAADLTVAFGPGSSALAAWTQGTVASTVMGATLRAS